MRAARQPELSNLFADLAQRMGLSRPAGQCFAAIWRAVSPPCADDLVTGLGLSRSNVSTALKELRQWGLIDLTRTPGDRKEYFQAPSDPWAIARQIMAERQRRELAPVLDRLYAIEAANPDARVAALCEVVEAFSSWTAGLARLDPSELADHVDRRTLNLLGDDSES
ncbi:GbsR/MarR family transcriptional regulator [Phaeovulum sp.]|uniref:GbsR/MarR family transcriptional regulator n=1 Tax=Phaeovulum sp. TaxID=2934796 RepID=UPI0039E4B5D5